MELTKAEKLGGADPIRSQILNPISQINPIIFFLSSSWKKRTAPKSTTTAVTTKAAFSLETSFKVEKLDKFQRLGRKGIFSMGRISKIYWETF